MSAIAPVAVAAILMLGTLSAISTINHASAQESSRELTLPPPLQQAGNATQGTNNPEPLQEMVPAMTSIPFQAHITTQQLSNGLTGEKPAASTNEGCYLAKESGGSLVCSPNSGSIVVERAPHTPVTAEQFGLQGFIYKINGKILAGMQCPDILSPQSDRVRDGVKYTICEPPVTAESLGHQGFIFAINGKNIPGKNCPSSKSTNAYRDGDYTTSYAICQVPGEATKPATPPGSLPTGIPKLH